MRCNARRDSRQIGADAHAALETALDRLGLSVHAFEIGEGECHFEHALVGVDRITRAHIAEAISYRNLDRSSWGE